MGRKREQVSEKALKSLGSERPRTHFIRKTTEWGGCQMLTCWWGLWCADLTRGLAGRWKGTLEGVRASEQVGRQEGETRESYMLESGSLGSWEWKQSEWGCGTDLSLGGRGLG